MEDITTDLVPVESSTKDNQALALGIVIGAALAPLGYVAVRKVVRLYRSWKTRRQSETVVVATD